MKNNLDLLKNLMKELDNSFYIYDEAVIKRQVETLYEKLPQFEFFYSVKANPLKPILEFLVSKDIGSDAASAEEVLLSEEIGLSKDRIIYSTPGKQKKDIEKTMDKAMIVADSYHELELLNEVAKEQDKFIKVGLRINMNFNGKSSSKFGVDEDSLIDHKNFIDNLKNIKISGIHVHLRSQILDYKRLSDYYETVFKLAVFCKEKLDFNMDFIDFGGGIGIVYSEKEENPLDFDKLSVECTKLVEKYNKDLKARLIIESGRFIICEAGDFVTKIVDIKESMGTKYLVAEKGLNGFLRPSLKEFLLNYIDRDAEIASFEPLFTRKDAFEFLIPEGDSKNLEEVVLAGSLCTSTDVLAKNINLPKVNIGDLVIVTKAGSYAYSLSPTRFANHKAPNQVYLKENGSVIVL